MEDLSTARLGNVDAHEGAISCEALGNSHSHDLQPLFRQAIEASGVPHKVVAIYLRVSPSYLSRMLSSEKQTTLVHVESAPHEVRCWFWRFAGQADGLTVSEVDPLAEALAAQQAATARVQAVLANRRLPERTTGQAKAAMEEG